MTLSFARLDGSEKRSQHLLHENLPVLLTGLRRMSSFRASLSLRMLMKVQCFRCPASVHSTKAIWQTSFGLTQGHSFIFSAVSTSPHREVLFSGRLVNGQCVAPAFLSTGKISFRIRGIRQEGSVLYFIYFRESACSVSMVVTAKRSAIDGALVQNVYSRTDPGMPRPVS